MKKIAFILILIGITSFVEYNLVAEQSATKHPPVGYVEHLDQTIPMNLKFVNSKGDTISLSQLVDRPTILSFAYYHCPGLCNTLLTGLRDGIDRVQLQPGKDFRVITVSIDYKEKSPVAAKWKRNYMTMEGTKRTLPDDSWQFMTGDSQSVMSLTNAAGYYFIPDGKEDFIHPSVILMLSPQGKITRYLLGNDFSPFDMKMAVIEAGQGKVMPTINKILYYCYSYDPSGKKYVLNFTRISGTILLIGIGVFFIILIKKGKKRKTA